MSQALAEKIDSVKSNRFIDSSLESLSEEIAAIQKTIAQALDADSEELGDAADFESSAANKLAERLDQIAGALTMLDMAEAGKLVEHLRIAVLKLGQSPEPASVKQRQAIFEAGYLLSRYTEYVRASRARSGDEMPLILSPCFYMLASAGLAPFMDESKLAGFNVGLVAASEAEAGVASEIDLPADDDIAGGSCMPPDYNPQGEKNFKQKEAVDANQATFRRLRKMYQVALIGLLRDSSSKEQLKLIDRVASRSAGLVGEPLLRTAWEALSVLVGQLADEKLAFTAQRKHFFARFDRWLRDMSKGHYIEFNEAHNLGALRELIMLLMLSGSQRYVQSAFDATVDIDSLRWSDSQVEGQRRAVESGLRDSVAAMGEAIGEQLGGMKQRLSAMSESELCEQADIEYLSSNMTAIAAVLKFCDFNNPALTLGAASEQVLAWQHEMPGESAMLQVANSILSVENALMCYSMSNCSGENDDDSQMSLEDGMIEQAHKHLFREMQSTISLSTRALSSYIESDFDREHIANVSHSLTGAIGGFQMVGLRDAAALAERCAVKIDAEYKNRETGDAQRLESIADCLVCIEYLLHELAAGRKLDGAMKQLIAENLAALED